LSTVEHEQRLLQRLKPGTMLSLKKWPDVGLWTVITCSIRNYPGPWTQIHLTLLHGNSVSNIEREEAGFFDDWDVTYQ